ncbi:Hypothetical predicted protein [Paramuricea clavata]|uniref:Uncharacterized protein n=1 Tax=Paramuricea clavata TaxID=317549 RepID=A0A6S7KJ28_PARCT|nr:Hypothetical predicted protein [Paramuricea clavata]
MLQNNKEKRWTRTNHTCTTNRLIRHRKAATQKSSLFMEDDSSVTDIDEEDAEEDDESGAPKIVFVLLAVSGAFLFLAVLVGICLWWINRRNKTKKLTKDRVSVNYKYDPMKRTDRQSIITDPTVTNDLE